MTVADEESGQSGAPPANSNIRSNSSANLSDSDDEGFTTFLNFLESPPEVRHNIHRSMLTDALESNNIALDASVSELDKLQEWRVKYGESAATVAENEKLSAELKEKENETTQLQNDLESSLNEIEELRQSVNMTAAAKGFNDFQHVVDDLKDEVKACKGESEQAKERIAQLESELEAKNSEIEKLHEAAEAAAAAGDGASMSAEENGEGDQTVQSSSRASRLFDNLRFLRSNPEIDDESADYPTMVRQRDLKIKSLEAMITSNTKIIGKMKNDIERMDTEKEEAEYAATLKIEQLTEENKTHEMQVASFEKAFMKINDQRSSDVSSTFKSIGDSEIVDNNMWDDDEDDVEGDEKDDEVLDLREQNLALQRMVTELQSSGSFQEDQIELLKAELVKLRVKSLQEKESAIAQLTEENKIVTAQRSALESQLVEINKGAGALRETLGEGVASEDHNGGSDPLLVSKVVRLENANKVLESSCNSLRSDMQEKLAPLMAQIALLEEEKRIIGEEMETKLSCREMTINNLESSLKQLHQGQRSPKKKDKSLSSKKKGKHHSHKS